MPACAAARVKRGNKCAQLIAQGAAPSHLNDFDAAAGHPGHDHFTKMEALVRRRNELGNRSGETRSDSNHFAAANANDRSFRHIDARGRSATGHCVKRARRAGGRMFWPRTRQPLAQTLPGKKAGVRKELANLNDASARFGVSQGAPVVVKRPRHGPAHEVVGVTVSRTGFRHGQSGAIVADWQAA